MTHYTPLNTGTASGASEQALHEVLETFPSLGVYGFLSKDRDESDEAFSQRLQSEREVTESVVKMFDSACREMRKLDKIKSKNSNCGSYTLKHLAEKLAGSYISNGILIAAAAHCGFKVYPTQYQSPNAYFNLSSRSVSAMFRRANRTGGES